MPTSIFTVDVNDDGLDRLEQKLIKAQAEADKLQGKLNFKTNLGTGVSGKGLGTGINAPNMPSAGAAGQPTSGSGSAPALNNGVKNQIRSLNLLNQQTSKLHKSWLGIGGIIRGAGTGISRMGMATAGGIAGIGGLVAGVLPLGILGALVGGLTKLFRGARDDRNTDKELNVTDAQRVGFEKSFGNKGLGGVLEAVSSSMADITQINKLALAMGSKFSVSSTKDNPVSVVLDIFDNLRNQVSDQAAVVMGQAFMSPAKIRMLRNMSEEEYQKTKANLRTITAQHKQSDEDMRRQAEAADEWDKVTNEFITGARKLALDIGMPAFRELIAFLEAPSTREAFTTTIGVVGKLGEAISAVLDALAPITRYVGNFITKEGILPGNDREGLLARRRKLDDLTNPNSMLYGIRQRMGIVDAANKEKAEVDRKLAGATTTTQSPSTPSIAATPGQQGIIDLVRRRGTELGYSEAQIAGILNNIQHESGFNATAHNKAGGGQGAFGLFQWRAERQRAYKQFRDSRGMDDATAGVEFMFHELNTTEKAARRRLLAATTPEDASYQFAAHFERPGEAHARQRYATGRRFYRSGEASQQVAEGLSANSTITSGNTISARSGAPTTITVKFVGGTTVTPQVTAISNSRGN